jgi:hypothetical protein
MEDRFGETGENHWNPQPLIAEIPIIKLICHHRMKVKRIAPSGMLRRVVLTRSTRRNIPEDGILHSHCRENIKS